MRSESSSALKVPELDLSRLTITDTTFQSFLVAQPSFSERIQSLTMDISALSVEGFDRFQYLPRHSTLKIALSNLSSLDALADCRHLRLLTRLDLRQNMIRVAGALVFASSVNMRSRTTLDLIGSGISSVGAQALRQQYSTCRISV